MNETNKNTAADAEPQEIEESFEREIESETAESDVETAGQAGSAEGLGETQSADETSTEEPEALAEAELISETADELELEADSDERESADDTVTFKRTHLYAALLPLAFAVGLSVGFLFWGRDTSSPSAPAAAAAAEAGGGQEQTGSAGQSQDSQAAEAQPDVNYENIVRYDVPIDDDPVLGPDDAPITIIEFSDFECPFCQKWHAEVFGRLIATYPTQIRFVYRDFPLTNIHPEAVPAANAANCASEQDAYWPFHEALFGGAYGLSESAYTSYATDLGLDLEAFGECVTEGRYEEEIQADFEYAAELGVSSTPTFFINGIAIVGAQPFEVFQQVIEAELAGEIPR